MVQPLSIVNQSAKRIESDFYVEGYATTFDEPYFLYEYDGVKYYEVIHSKALNNTDMSDVIMQYDHQGKVLARQSNSTLGIEPDFKGLFSFADLSKSSAAKELYEEINNQLITKMSWAFVVAKDGDSYSKNGNVYTRRIHDVRKIYDVSAVSSPANSDTNISARSYFNGVIEVEKREALVRRRKLLILKTKLNLEV